MGDLDAAEHALLRALELDEREHGPDHPDVFADLTALGNVRRLRGDEDAATRALERAVEIGAKSTDSANPAQMRSALAGLADVLQRAGDIAGAEATLDQAVKLDEALYGSGRQPVQTTLEKLAAVLQRAHETASSEQTLERARQLGEQQYLSDYPRLAAWTAAVSQLIVDQSGPTQLPPGEPRNWPHSVDR